MASREFHELLQKQFRRSALMQRSDRQRRRPEAASPIKQHSLWANLNVISRAGTAASLDFYHLAPASLHRYTATRDRSRLDISPVLRVNTTVFEVLRLLDSSEPLVKELEPLLASMGLSASPLEESQK